MLEASVYQWAMLVTCVREVYEAVALIAFMDLVFLILGGPKRLAQLLVAEDDRPVEHIWPLCLILPPYTQGAHFVASVILGIFQYVFVCLVYLAAIILIWCLGLCGMNPFVTKCLKAVPVMVKACSCAWALNCLVLFARQVKEHVPACGLVLKFLSIKGIVFFTFWQASVIWLLEQSGYFAQIEDYVQAKATSYELQLSIWNEDEIKSGLNDLLLCIEVLAFSIMHWYAYPPREVDTLPLDVQRRLKQPEEGYVVDRLIETASVFDFRGVKEDLRELVETPGFPEAVKRERWGLAPLAFVYFQRRRKRHEKNMAQGGESNAPLLSPQL